MTPMTYEPTLASLNAHPVPQWYDDAKFGIFIHWGMWAIPAFAGSSGSIGEIFRDHFDKAVAMTPYTEWYENAIKVPGTPSAKFHAEMYGNMPYSDFRDPFLETIDQWDPDAWADQFARAGAKYVVLVSKHHDGFCLWPSDVKNPKRDNWHSRRDIVGELGEAVRARGMRYGLYYSGGIDWSFNPKPLRTLGEFISSAPRGKYPAYATAQVRELIERYRPSILWNDISWPTPLAPQLQLFADYYNEIDDGVVNDRWMPQSWKTALMRLPPVRRSFDRAVRKRMQSKTASKGITPPKPPHFDFQTPEYATFSDIAQNKWEATRGMSHSFGFNRNDTDADYLSAEEIVHGFADAVSKNGNLLLNVGPRGDDGTIPKEQTTRLDAFGNWITRNSQGVYGTRPWTRAEGKAIADGETLDVRFTCTDTALYAHVLSATRPQQLTISDLPVTADTHIDLLGHGPVQWQGNATSVTLTLPAKTDADPAWTLAIPHPAT